MQIDPPRLLEPVLAVAREAGREILKIYQSEFAVEFKDDQSPLTAADRTAHLVIARALAHVTPNVPLWSEESGTPSYSERSHWAWFWLVDPLDGTREFITRNDEFTVNIALVRGQEPVLGVVHVPVLKRDYYGCHGVGAFRRDAASADSRPISVQSPANDPVRVVISRSHATGSLQPFLKRVGAHDPIAMGSSLKFCLVAEGTADVYPRLGPTSEWDTAAAQAVVEAAGGRVVDLAGRPLRYNTGPDIVNPPFLVFGDPSRDWVRYLDPERRPTA